ncbi:cation:proton antiporter [Polycladidibacter hongkongensis]|uniref:cation:proton antiporter n=1 Tax=Polycladidibacter hongkongensis TaxID=1647556 RepID=UPI00082FE4ED|nr:cation:proton antiporter [Pseudovibrio hongkongensis]
MSALEAFAGAYLEFALHASLIILGLSLLLTAYRVCIGPNLPDRVVGLDLLVAIAIGLIAVFGILSKYSLYVDIALALGLVGFLATVAFARFILNRGLAKDQAILNETNEVAETNTGESQ